MNDLSPNSIRKIKSYPDLLRKEVLAALFVLAILSLVSAILDAPLSGPADPSGIPPENVKAPWIFVGIQLMLRSLPPLVAGIVLPLAAVMLLALMPYFFRTAPTLFKIMFGVIISACLVLTIWGYIA